MNINIILNIIDGNVSKEKASTYIPKKILLRSVLKDPHKIIGNGFYCVYTVAFPVFFVPYPPIPTFQAFPLFRGDFPQNPMYLLYSYAQALTCLFP